MPNNDTVTVRGAVKIDNLPDLACFTSFKDFLKELPNLLTLELPVTISNVIVSNIQPTDALRSSVWFRMSNSGSFIGIYLYSGGAWRQIFPIPEPVVQVFWVAGDSRDIPVGFELVDAGNPNFTASQRTHIMAQYLSDPTNTFYEYFAVNYVGV